MMAGEKVFGKTFQFNTFSQYQNYIESTNKYWNKQKFFEWRDGNETEEESNKNPGNSTKVSTASHWRQHWGGKYCNKTNLTLFSLIFNLTSSLFYLLLSIAHRI